MKPAIRITIICVIIALGCVPGLFKIVYAQPEAQPAAPYTLWIDGYDEDAITPPVVTLEADYYRVTWVKPDGAEWQAVTRGTVMWGETESEVDGE